MALFVAVSANIFHAKKNIAHTSAQYMVHPWSLSNVDELQDLIDEDTNVSSVLSLSLIFGQLLLTSAEFDLACWYQYMGSSFVYKICIHMHC